LSILRILVSPASNSFVSLLGPPEEAGNSAPDHFSLADGSG